MSGPHDLLFRETFAATHAAAWLLRVAIPDLRSTHAPQRIDTPSVDAGTLRQPDLIWQVAPDLRVRVAWQHQSTVDPLMDLRVLHDTAVLLRAWNEPGQPLPALITVVISHTKRPWTTPTDVQQRMTDLPAQLADRVVRCPYVHIDLRDLPEHTLRSAPPAAQVTLRLLRAWQDAAKPLWDVFFDMAPLLHHLIRQGGISTMRRFTSYLLRTQPPATQDRIMAQLAQLHPDLPEGFVSWADEIEDRGFARGEEEGFARGEALGELRAARRTLLTLATAKLGEPTADQARAVQQLTLDELEQATLRVLHASTWDALLG